MLANFPLEIIHKKTFSGGSAFIAQYFDIKKENIVLVTGQDHSLRFADQLMENVDQTIIHSVKIDRASVERLKVEQKKLQNVSHKYIIGIGGGSAIDFAKQLSFYSGSTLILVPTIIANDGLISPISVLFQNGKSVSLGSKMPDLVLLIDEIIKQAPERYLQAAACDILSNLSASNDWQLAFTNNAEKIQHLAYQFSQIAANSVLSARNYDVHDSGFYRCILDGQLLSGMAMAFAGSSRPCSGSEHLISHAIDSMALAPNVLHGTKIGIISKFILTLQGVSSENLIRFFQNMSIKNKFPGCEKFSYADLVELFALSRTMRPGRYTILDTLSDSSLADRYLRHIDIE